MLFPYLGERHTWFAESFASFMQYQVMQEMGVLSDSGVTRKYRENIERAVNNYQLHDLPFAHAAQVLRQQRKYPTLYWGGAVYFLQVDHELKKSGHSLVQLLSDYVICCRLRSHRLPGLVEELDRLSDSRIFSNTLTRMRNKPGIPPVDHLF